MPQWRDFLNRFRPAGAPGAAARVAVPADRSAELEAELRPVLALLDDANTGCARIVARARDEAAQIVAAARAEAAASLRDASGRAGAVRAAAVQQVMTVAHADAAGTVAAARQEAREVAGLARQRIPVLAARAVDLVRGLGGPDPDPAAGWPGRRGEPGRLG